MQIELAMAKKHLAVKGWPVREETPQTVDRAEVSNRRLMMRTEIDDLMKVGFVQGDIVGFSIRLCRCALALAGTAAQFCTAPEYAHFSEGAIDLLQGAQHKLDRALLTQDWHAVRVALAQIETVIFGISANFGMPYGEVLAIIDAAYSAGVEVPREAVAVALRRAGLEVPNEASEAANDR